VEGIAEEPVWLLRDDMQFSVAHKLAVATHRVSPAKAWQDPKLMIGLSVMELMDKVVTEVHPAYFAQFTEQMGGRVGPAVPIKRRWRLASRHCLGASQARKLFRSDRLGHAG
jgi:2-methylcitrate dehydratase PrpD